MSKSKHLVGVLLVIKNTPICTSKDIQEKVMPNLTLRSVQRYLGGLERDGLVKRCGGGFGGYRYFLAGAAKELCGAEK